jgi:acyl carrier protein
MEAVSTIWAGVLRLPAVAPDANFFDIGGDSLKAMEVITRVAETLHVQLPLVAFFEDATVTHISAVIDELKGPETSEQILAGIWAEVLRVPTVATDANFFDIGGDSLKAMEVISRVAEALKAELPLMAFFEDPTIAHLASVVDELKPAANAGIVRVSDRREFPLSWVQQAFWLLEQQDPEAGVYSTARVFRIRGKLDAGVLERSFNELRRRHEILRVRVIPGVDGPVQVVAEARSLPLPVTDLSAVEESAREQALSKLALEAYRTPFDLGSGNPLRAHLVRMAPEEHALCIVLHHVAGDGFTGSILLEELSAIYDAFAAGEPNPLPEVDLHYTDYAAWERQWMQGARLEEELDYWRAVLAGAPSSVDLPTDYERPEANDRRGYLRHITIPKEEMQRLQTLARAHGTTLFTVVSTGLRILLHRWSGQNDFLVGTVAANRSRSGTERMIGCFINPLPLRNPIHGDERAVDLLEREKNAILGVFAHQDCPFAKIVEAVKPERTSSDNPLFNVALLLQNFPEIALNGRNFRAEAVDLDPEMAILDLRFIAVEERDGLQIWCEYRSSILGEQTADALLAGYRQVLAELASDPVQPVAAIAIPQVLVRQAAAARKRDHRAVVAVAASFTAEPLEQPLSLLLGELGMKYRVSFAPYQQVFQQLLDPASLLRTADGFGIVLVRFEDGPGAAADELISVLCAVRHRGAAVIVCLCPPSRTVPAVVAAEWERKIIDGVAEIASVHVIGSEEILDLYPVEQYEDEYAQRLGNVPYTADFFSAIATMLARKMWNVAENHCQVIALGSASPELSDALREQFEGGMLLCATGNVPDLPIEPDYIVATAFGPQTTAKRLRQLAREIGLGLESFIFLDSDPDECAAMEAAHPEVLTLQVPAASEEIPGWLRHVWAFDPCRNSQRHLTATVEAGA